MAVKKNDPGLILPIAKLIYQFIRPWFVEQAAKTETPIDDWMIMILDRLFALMAAKKAVDPGLILAIAKLVYQFIRPWLVEQAANTATPIDDWMITILDKLFNII
jgi:hypothetical protein